MGRMDIRTWGTGPRHRIRITGDGHVVERASEDDGTPTMPRACLEDMSGERALIVLGWFADWLHANLMALPAGHRARIDLERRRIPARDRRLGWAPGLGAILAAARSHGFTDLDLLMAGIVDAGTLDEGLLFSPLTDRLTIAIEHDGRVERIWARSFDDARRKYTSSHLRWGFARRQDLFYGGVSRTVAGDGCVLVEGQFDAIACDLAGIAAVSANGCDNIMAENHDEIKRIAGDRPLTIVPDSDDAGREGVATYMGRYPDDDVLVVDIPDGADPCSYRAEHGDAAMRAAISRRIPVSDWLRAHGLRPRPSSSVMKPYRERRQWVRQLTPAPVAHVDNGIAARCRRSERFRIIAGLYAAAIAEGVDPAELGIDWPRAIVNGSPTECGRYGAHGDVASLTAMIASMSFGHAV